MITKVYVVLAHWENEGDDIISAYTTEKLANEAALKYTDPDRPYKPSYHVQQVRVYSTMPGLEPENQ